MQPFTLITEIDQLYGDAMHGLKRSLLLEMNVANLDAVRAAIADLLHKQIEDRAARIPPTVTALFAKRLLKSLQNDTAGEMIIPRPMTAEDLGADAPEWLTKALAAGQEVVTIEIKPEIAPVLSHLVDWMAADADAQAHIKAAPERDFLGTLNRIAARFYETVNQQQAAEVAAAEAHARKSGQKPIPEEAGREVVLTFRQEPQTGVVRMFAETSLLADARGPVVMFWAALNEASALDREGRLMDHCVKNTSYANLVAAEQIVIYSLRDANNTPHCTIEFSKRGGREEIHQVKGKGNRPPLGLYAPYLRDFLTTLKVPPGGSQGQTDVRGAGIFYHNGKYGTIADIDAPRLINFPKGDSLRFMEGDKATQATRWGGMETLPDTFNYYYIEKDGTAPLKLTIKVGTEQTAMQGAKLQRLDIQRPEKSRYPIYCRNLIAFCNENAMTAASSKTGEAIGLFFDARHRRFGTAEELTETVLSLHGASVRRLAEDLFFVDRDGTVFARALQGRSGGLNSLKIVNEVEATSLLPELVRTLANRDIGADYELLNSDQKRLLRSYGAVYNAAKGSFGAVPEKREVFKSASGSVRAYANHLYFYRGDMLVGSAHVGKPVTTHESVPVDGEPGVTTLRSLTRTVITPNQLFSIGDGNRAAVLALLSDLTVQRPEEYTVDNFAYDRTVRELGYFEMRHALVPITTVEKTIKLAHGIVASSQARTHGAGLYVKVQTTAGAPILAFIIDDDGTVEVVHYGSSESRDLASADAPALAAALNSFGARMRKRRMLRYFLKEKYGKFAALSAPADAGLIAYVNGKVDLGGGFTFDRHYNGLDRDDMYDDKPFEPKRLGSIEYKTSTVVQVEYHDAKDGVDLSYRMRRHLPEDGPTRAQVIAVTAKFMQFFHAKLEPFFDDSIVGRAPC